MDAWVTMRAKKKVYQLDSLHNKLLLTWWLKTVNICYYLQVYQSGGWLCWHEPWLADLSWAHSCVYNQLAGLLGGGVLVCSGWSQPVWLPVGVMGEIGPHVFHHPPGYPEFVHMSWQVPREWGESHKASQGSGMELACCYFHSILLAKASLRGQPRF